MFIVHTYAKLGAVHKRRLLSARASAEQFPGKGGGNEK